MTHLRLLTRIYLPVSPLKTFAVSLSLLLGPASALRGLQTRIIGGSVANPTRYPYFAALGLATVGIPDSYSQCGGTLIHDDIVLTAAHCIDSVASFDKAQSYVYVGLSNEDATSGYYEAKIQTIVPHPNYKNENSQNDIMILKLDRSITQVKPIALNTERSLPATGAVETVIGFGLTSNGGSISALLREVQVKSVSYQVCNMAFGNILDNLMTCAYADGKDSCQGDSGGPLILAGSSAAMDVQVGVVSFGYQCAIKDSPGVYTRVSNYNAWITGQICSLSSKKPASCSGSAPTAAPTTKPKTSPFCFSSESAVQVKNKGTMLMKELEIGDEVLAATGKYEPVYSFGHRHESVNAEFLQLLPSGLEISRDHMLLVRGKYVPASAVQLGDELESANGDIITVEAIDTVVRSGVYAPFTYSGTIVVSNVKASNYIAFQDSDRLIVGGWVTPFTYQWIAHMSQSPHRILSRLGLSGAEEDYILDGMSTWISGPLQLSQWLIDQNAVIVTVMLVPAIGVGMLSMGAESVISMFL